MRARACVSDPPRLDPEGTITVVRTGAAVGGGSGGA